MNKFQVIKLDEAKKAARQTEEFSFVLDGNAIKDEFEHITFNCPIKIDLSLTYDDDVYYLTGQLSTSIVLECSRCLEKLNFQINYDICERYSTKPQSDEDIIILNKEELDLLEIVREAIIFSIPKKVLCNESCLGLCPLCGCNLNISKCQCENDDVDPRLAILKDLFKE